MTPMDKRFKDLNETFDVTGEIVSSEPIKPIPKEVEAIKTDTRKDYEYTRGNLYSLIEKGQEAVNGILELAQETEQARAYEVAGQLIKSVADATDKLLTYRKNLKMSRKIQRNLLLQTSPTHICWFNSRPCQTPEAKQKRG